MEFAFAWVEVASEKMELTPENDITNQMDVADQALVWQQKNYYFHRR